MEIYRNTPAIAKLAVPVAAPTNFDVVAKDGATVLYTFPTVTKVTDGYTVTLPFSLVDRDREFVIEWSFDYVEGTDTKSYTATTKIEVVTPYANLELMRDALGASAESLTDTELFRAERKVRGIIDTFTGQTFGYFRGTIYVSGSDETKLRLPRPLISFDSVSLNGVSMDLARYKTFGENWFLGGTNLYPDGDIKADVTPGLAVVGPIYSPWSRQGPFREDNVYAITGVWGYEGVPREVEDAALILIDDLLASDSVLRNRYVGNLRYADSRIEFNAGAFSGTGNVLADQLLSNFKRTNMLVI